MFNIKKLNYSFFIDNDIDFDIIDEFMSGIFGFNDY